jgi:hypothetical protein
MYNYDAQIAKLTKNPKLIPIEWQMGNGLFKVIGNNQIDDCHAGCLTTIRDADPSVMDKAYINGEYDPVLTKQIRDDNRLPRYVRDITVEMLPVFKEWQEKIDKMQNTY